MAIINLDRVPYPDVLSVKITDSGAKDIVNGMLIGVKEKVDGQLDLYKGVKAAAGDRVGIIAQPFHPYKSDDVEDNMTFVENDVVRVYLFKRGEAYTVAKSVTKGSISVGDKVKVGADYKWEKDTAGTEAIAICTGTRVIAGQNSLTLEIL